MGCGVRGGGADHVSLAAGGAAAVQHGAGGRGHPAGGAVGRRARAQLRRQRRHRAPRRERERAASVRQAPPSLWGLRVGVAVAGLCCAVVLASSCATARTRVAALTQGRSGWGRSASWRRCAPRGERGFNTAPPVLLRRFGGMAASAPPLRGCAGVSSGSPLAHAASLQLVRAPVGVQVGLVLVDRNTVIVGPCDVTLSFGAHPVEVPGTVRCARPRPPPIFTAAPSRLRHPSPTLAPVRSDAACARGVGLRAREVVATGLAGCVPLAPPLLAAPAGSCTRCTTSRSSATTRACCPRRRAAR